jgi:hypothetical protein
MLALGALQTHELVILFGVLIFPVIIVIVALRLTRRERRDGFPVEPPDPASRPPDGK